MLEAGPELDKTIGCMFGLIPLQDGTIPLDGRIFQPSINLNDSFWAAMQACRPTDVNPRGLAMELHFSPNYGHYIGFECIKWDTEYAKEHYNAERYTLALAICAAILKLKGHTDV